MRSDSGWEDQPAKTVGRRQPPRDPLKMDQAQQIDAAKAWKRAFRYLPIPKGVYRFRTHEEADDWLWKMLTRRRP